MPFAEVLGRAHLLERPVDGLQVRATLGVLLIANPDMMQPMNVSWCEAVRKLSSTSRDGRMSRIRLDAWPSSNDPDLVRIRLVRLPQEERQILPPGNHVDAGHVRRQRNPRRHHGVFRVRMLEVHGEHISPGDPTQIKLRTTTPMIDQPSVAAAANQLAHASPSSASTDPLWELSQMPSSLITHPTSPT